MTIETNSHQPVSERTRLGVAPNRRIDVDIWSSPEVDRDVFTDSDSAYQSPNQMHQQIAAEHRARAFDPHSGAINRLAKKAMPSGRYSNGGLEDFNSPSGKPPQHRAETPTG